MGVRARLPTFIEQLPFSRLQFKGKNIYELSSLPLDAKVMGKLKFGAKIMTKRFFAFILALSMSLVLGACGKNDNFTTGSLRLVNAVSDGSSVDMLKDGQLLESDIGYLEASAYDEMRTGAHEIQVVVSEGFREFTRRTVSIAEKNYTIIAAGSTASPTSLFFTDDFIAPDSGRIKLRFINAAKERKGSVDVFVTPEDEADGDAALKNISFGANSKYFDGKEGNYTFAFKDSKTGALVARSAVSLLDGGSVHSIVLAADGSGFNVIVLDD